MNKGDQADQGTLSYRTLANDFRKEIRSKAKTGNRGFKPGAFGPTYGHDQADQYHESEEVLGDASNEKG